ncbi:hypothetical protein Tco_1244977 [Tanacetum coccineum]
MSSASSAVTYTYVYTDSEPGKGRDSAHQLQTMFQVLSTPTFSPQSEVPYVPEPEYPEYLVPSDDEAPMEDQPLPADASPIALSPGYVADSDSEGVAPTHVPSPRRHTVRMSVRPQTPVPLPSEAEVERLLALPIPPPSPLTPLSSPLPQIPSPSSLHLPPPVPTSLPLPLSPLPPLPASLFIPTSPTEG